MDLLSKYIPEYSFKETHFRDVSAHPTIVIDAAAAFRPEADAFFRKMIAVRELPMRLKALFGGRQTINPAPFGFHNFILLEKQNGSGLVYGLIGRFWQSDYGLVTVPDAQAFLTFNDPGTAKLVVGFSAIPQGDGRTRLVTETRIYCPDRATWLRFAPYWYLIRPVSGLIRVRILAIIKTMSERSSEAHIS